MQTTWQRVNRKEPCSVCGKPDWCTRSNGVACCMRVASAKQARNGGWIHRLDGSKTYLPIPAAREAPRAPVNFSMLAQKYRNNMETRRKEQLARELGVTANALTCLGVGWDGEAFTFPMQDAGGIVVGIRRRFADGRKLSVKGGHEGCFVPFGVPGDLATSIVVCEGPSDTAALLDLRYEVIGRPSCTGGTEIVKRLARKMDVVIVADDDEPGIRGAERLARALKRPGRIVKIIRPLRGKDAREWARYANREVVDSVIANAIPF